MARLRDDRSVDADNLASHVDERTTAVAGIDGRVRLQKTLKCALFNIPAGFPELAAPTSKGADNTGRHGMVELEGTANGQHPIANLDGIRIPQFCRRQVLAGVNLDDRQVRPDIGADKFRVILGLVVQDHLDLVGLIDDVVVGQDVAGPVEDETAPETLRLTRGIVPAASAEEIEEIIERIL